MKYVIIGNSAAGIGCVEGIRQIDKNGNITVISDESHHTYSRPLISYFVQGKVTAEKMKYRPDSFYRDNAFNFLGGISAARIAPDTKTIVLSDGKTVSYDKLLLATGSRTFMPPFAGIDSLSSKTAFMTMHDAQKLENMLTGEKKVVIIGAGLIGLKCAEGILGRVSSITVVDLAPHVLASILDSGGAALVHKHFEENGVQFRLSQSVQRFDPAAGGQAENCAVLDDGSMLHFDIAVMAAGVRPKTELLADIARIDKGIVINEKCETSRQDIYAAGDCTESIDIASGRQKIMALLPNAYMQGECAGVNMAGGEKIYNKAIPMNAIGFMGLHVLSAGNYTGDVYQSDTEGVYRKLFYSDNRLNGFIFIGDIEKAGIYTSLIREQTPLDSIDFALICERPGLMAFTKEERMVKLGGVTS